MELRSPLQQTGKKECNQSLKSRKFSFRGQHIKQCQNMSTNDVEDSDSSHYYSGIENEVTHEVEHKEGSNEDEQIKSRRYPLKRTSSMSIKYKQHELRLRKKSLSENNLFQQIPEDSLLPKSPAKTN